MPRAAIVLALVAAVAATQAWALDADDTARLERLVLQDCGSCHGLTRKGGLGSPLTADALQGAVPEALASIILDGVPGTAMPPWRPLMSEDEARWIAEYLLKGDGL